MQLDAVWTLSGRCLVPNMFWSHGCGNMILHAWGMACLQLIVVACSCNLHQLALYRDDFDSDVYCCTHFFQILPWQTQGCADTQLLTSASTSITVSCR